MVKSDRIQVRVDPKIKKQATDLFSELGLSMSDAVSLFLRQSLKERAIPFQVTYRIYEKNED